MQASDKAVNKIEKLRKKKLKVHKEYGSQENQTGNQLCFILFSIKHLR